MPESPDTSHLDHERTAANLGPLGFAVLTLSDTRDANSDKSGQFLRNAVTAAGHQMSRYAIVKDDPAQIKLQLEGALRDPQVSVIITNGGTGISARDSAYEVVSGLLEKRLDGFGELFRMLSYQEIGSAAMLSRAVAGIAQGKVIFALPGSTKAVKLALEQLILPQAAHLHQELHKHDRG